ncbi:RNA polymerase sigma factor [Prevotella sp. E9-3]|uniref:RNA polymerase sigma factor n=1 Tax=Prevotella sp. E9-3 TaxID=2913621 RepID=UPI001EDAFDCF|nr:RNA polymerase sigma factor [Prevotella sp. E9-3]UKK47457.1 RNA polymerase sigma factor [Prevotella sp. E9-3]
MLIPLRLSALTDEQLMRRAAHGSDRAFEELYNRHARRLQGFFTRRLGSDADLASDFVHDTFLRLYAARETYCDGRSFRAWLYTIAYNLVKNHLRSQQPVVISDEKDIPDDCNIEVELDMQNLHDALSGVLKNLPEPYAMLFSLHYEEELTVPQIAQITDLPEGTVKSRLHKTMNIIKLQLKAYENR